jgi:hypothetical protein
MWTKHRLGGYPGYQVSRAVLKPVGDRADSEGDSRLGTDGNHNQARDREGAADDAALLMRKTGVRSGGFR